MSMRLVRAWGTPRKTWWDFSRLVEIYLHTELALLLKSEHK